MVSGNVLEELHCENSELGALLDLDEHSYGREKPFDQLLCYGDSNRRLNGSHGIVTLQDALKDDVAAGATVTQVDTAQPGVTVKGTVWKDASAGDMVLIVAVNEPIHGSATKPLLLKSSRCTEIPSSKPLCLSIEPRSPGCAKVAPALPARSR